MPNNKTIKWIYSPSKSWDFGFVDVPWEAKGYYVHSFNKKDALPWDEVLAKIKTFKWRDEAVIQKVLKRSEKIFIWTFQEGRRDIDRRTKKEFISFWFVSVRDENFKTDIFIPWKFIKNSRNWDLVWVKIISWDNKKNPKWKIIKVLWKSENSDYIMVESFILEAWFKEEFSREAMVDIRKLPKKINIKKNLDSKNRKDLRKMFVFTIDWEDAKDLDDAISIEKKDNGEFILYVHIADVAEYVKEYSWLDKDAFFRATSVYLVDRVIPMLPRELSNNLCSLNTDFEKLSLTCEMNIWKDWVIRKSKVFESIIKSDYRLTYKEVDDIEKWEIKIWTELFWWQKFSKELDCKLKQAWELKEILEKNRKLKWFLDFDFPETKIVLDENKNVIEIKEYPKYNSNKLIELFMVSANHSISKMFKDIPFLHRIHPEPTAEDIEKLQNILNIFWVNYKIEKLITKEFSKLLNLINIHPAKEVLEKAVLRALTKAIYSPDNEGHFGLGLDYYSHFTSPIRRYPDLQIHRIIKEKLVWKLNRTRIFHYENILKNVANHCSDKERVAEQLEYKVKDYYICKYYKNKVWEEFFAQISWIISKWFFVMLEDTAEGFIELKDNKNFIFNEDLMQFENKNSKKIYRLWDKIKVKLIEVDMVFLRMNFEIL